MAVKTVVISNEDHFRRVLPYSSTLRQFHPTWSAGFKQRYFVDSSNRNWSWTTAFLTLTSLGSFRKKCKCSRFDLPKWHNRVNSTYTTHKDVFFCYVSLLTILDKDDDDDDDDENDNDDLKITSELKSN